MKKTFMCLVAALLLSAALPAAAQTLTIPATAVSFTLPEGEWQYLRTFSLDDGANVYLYSYVGRVLVDADGDTALPCLRIYVRENYTDDLYQLSYERYTRQPYQMLNDYTRGPGLPRSGGLGYDAIYTNPADGRDYRFLMTYFKDRRTAVEFRLETTQTTWDKMKPVFDAVMASIR